MTQVECCLIVVGGEMIEQLAVDINVAVDYSCHHVHVVAELMVVDWRERHRALSSVHALLHVLNRLVLCHHIGVAAELDGKCHHQC